MTETFADQLKMPIYTGSCGKQILIIPDVCEMTKAISDHIIEHNKTKRKPLTEEKLAQEIIKTIIEVEQRHLEDKKKKNWRSEQK